MKWLVLIALVAAACEPKKAEPSGIGKWRFTKTVRKDAVEGICSKETTEAGRAVTWCHTMPPIKIGNRAATVDLYFEGHADDGKLVEIQLGVRGCVEDELDRWIRAVMGPPVETRATRAYWQNRFMFIAAMMPKDPGRCVVYLLPLAEKAEIDRRKAE